jgi:ribosome biogenesis protein Nip4
MPFLYGNHILKAHLGRITEDTPEHQGVVVYSMNDVPLVNGLHLCLIGPNICLQGFGVTSRSAVDTRKLDPTAIVVFHQAYVILVFRFSFFPEKIARDVGEYLRDEVKKQNK